MRLYCLFLKSNNIPLNDQYVKLFENLDDAREYANTTFITEKESEEMSHFDMIFYGLTGQKQVVVPDYEIVVYEIDFQNQSLTNISN